MEAESGSHPSRTIAHSAHTSSQNAPIPSLLSCLWYYNRCFASLTVTVHTLHLHRTAEKTFVVIKSAATMNAFINIEKQQLHPLNGLIRLVIQYRTGPGPAPVPVPVPFPAPCFSSCPLKLG